MTKQKIIEKVKKLHAKAQSAEEMGSMEEAQVFAAKVKEMMDNHKLSMSDIAYKDYSEADIETEVIRWSNYGHKDVSKRELWTSKFLGVVCEYNSCRYRVYVGSNACIIYGRRDDIEAIKVLLAVLIPVCIRLEGRAYHIKYHDVHDNYPRNMWKSMLKGFRISWKIGFIDGVLEALEEQSKASQAKALAQGGNYALVRLSGAIKAVDSYIQANCNSNRTVKSTRNSYNNDGYHRGHKEGKAAVNRNQVEG